MHGLRGEVNLIVKVELFSDLNKVFIKHRKFDVKSLQLYRFIDYIIRSIKIIKPNYTFQYRQSSCGVRFFFSKFVLIYYQLISFFHYLVQLVFKTCAFYHVEYIQILNNFRSTGPGGICCSQY